MAATFEQMLEISNGDREAATFCMALRQFFHLIDDLWDRDRLVTQEHIARTIAGLFTAVVANPFWHRHSMVLLPLIVNGLRAWLDSDIWSKQGEKWQIVAADVFKSYYHEIFYQVAYITGGWEHMSAMTEKYRRVNWDNEMVQADKEKKAGQPAGIEPAKRPRCPKPGKTD